MTTETWEFADPPDTASIADRRIVFESAWIAYVARDGDDGTWQFHTAGARTIGPDQAAVVSLHGIVKRDPSVAALADLRSGWCAWRTTKYTPWERAPHQR